MKIPDGWFRRLLELGKRAKSDIEGAFADQALNAAARGMALPGAAERAPEVALHIEALIEQYAGELQTLARELQAESAKELRAQRVAELAAVLLQATLLRDMDREAVIKAANVARQLLDEAAGTGAHEEILS
jgi:hypothetical protein